MPNYGVMGVFRKLINGSGPHVRAINERILSGSDSLSAIVAHFRSLKIQPSSSNTLLSQIKTAARASWSEYNTDLQFRDNFNSTLSSLRHKIYDQTPAGRAIEIEQLNQLIAFSGPRTSLWFETLYYTSGRVSAVCDLRFTDVVGQTTDPETGMRLIIIRMRGKGRQRKHNILITEDLLSRIRQVFSNSKIYLFETRHGNQYDRRDVYKLLADASDRILGFRVSPHDMRRTFATEISKRPDVPEKSVLLHGDWNNIEVFRNTYDRQPMLRPSQIPQTNAIQVGYRQMERTTRKMA